jgi:hypothetical protein
VQQALVRVVEVLGSSASEAEAMKLGMHVLAGLAVDAFRRRCHLPVGDAADIVDFRLDAQAPETKSLRELIEEDPDLVRALGSKGIALLVEIGNGVRTNKGLARHLRSDAKSVRLRRRRVRRILTAVFLQIQASARAECPPQGGNGHMEATS